MSGVPLPVIQGLQVLTVAGGAPGVSGFIAWLEARLQGRRGPRILQPYFDLAKLFGKETLVPQGAGPLFRLAPVASFACYLTVPMLIPVLTSYALPLGYMGDILGGGLILAFASFLVAAAAAETGDAYAQLASSRAKTFAAITEPVMLLVVFTVAMITTTDLPYVLGATVRSGARPDRSTGSPAGLGGVVHGDPVRNRAHPSRNSHRHNRIRHDRIGAIVRVLRP